MARDSAPQDVLARTLSDRIGIAVLACIIGSIASWMWWIVQSFLDGGTWGDFIVRLILHDLIFATGLFAAALLLHVIAPRFTTRLLRQSIEKVGLAILLVSGLFGSTVIFFLLVLPVLLMLGIVR